MNLSIIIPCYNVEAYVEECLNSLIVNVDSEMNYEIIIINDGSTDKTLSLINKFKNIKNVRIISQENKGLSATRNLGLKLASGEYIHYCDSDDWVDLNELISATEFSIKNKLDICIANFKNVLEDKITNNPTTEFHSLILESGYNIFNCYYLDKISSVVWRSLYKRTYLLDNQFFFIENVYFEDMEFSPKVLLNAPKVGIIPVFIYYYRKRLGSIMNSSYNAKKFTDTYKIIEALKNIANHSSKIICNKIIFSMLIKSLVLYEQKLSKIEKKNINDTLQYLSKSNLMYKFISILYKISPIASVTSLRLIYKIHKK